MCKLWEEHSKRDLIAHWWKIKWCEEHKLHAHFLDIAKMWIQISWGTEEIYDSVFHSGNLEAKMVIENILRKKYKIKPKDIPFKKIVFNQLQGIRFDTIKEIIRMHLKLRGKDFIQ